VTSRVVATLLVLLAAPVAAAPPVPAAECPRAMRASWSALCDAANRGEPGALMTLGAWRVLGINGPRDPAEGERLVALAAAAGHVRARYALGVLLARREPDAARAHWRAAAAEGCLGAAIMLLREEAADGGVAGEALRARAEALAAEPTARRDDWAALARLLDQAGMTEQGAALRREGAARADALMAPVFRARNLAAARQIPRAIALLEQARAERPDVATRFELDHELALLHRQSGDRARAADAATAALVALRTTPCAVPFDGTQELELVELLAERR
jgi:tetratricopeptide (TPR) repeat protein